MAASPVPVPVPPPPPSPPQPAAIRAMLTIGRREEPLRCAHLPPVGLGGIPKSARPASHIAAESYVNGHATVHKNILSRSRPSTWSDEWPRVGAAASRGRQPARSGQPERPLGDRGDLVGGEQLGEALGQPAA